MVFKRNLGFYIGASLLLLSSYMFYKSFTYKFYTENGPGPGLMPRLMFGLMIILSIIYIFESVTKHVVITTDVLPQGIGLKNVLRFSGVLALFIVIVKYTGFIVAGSLILFLLLRREYKWYAGLGISVFACVFLFYVFQNLLHVPLPVNAFGW